jgi:uroporphyrinogen decarboxylase
LMIQDPVAWDRLMTALVDLLAQYLNGQIAAGADAVQLFDSWVGALSPDDYRQHVLPHVKQLIDRVTPGTPVIHFATGNPMLVPLLKEAGGDVIGLDWRCDLAQAWTELGSDVAVMGNLDPITLYASPEQIRTRVKAILDKAGGRPGHIFNLGHGVMPDMNPQHIAELVDAVHELSAR